MMTYKDVCSSNEKNTTLSNIKKTFVFSHAMYWTVLSDSDELELFVPSTINPLTEDDVCTMLLPVNSDVVESESSDSEFECES